MAMRVKFDIQQTFKLNDESRKRFSKYSKMYLMTTENIDGYYHNFDFKNKTVLTVTSSFDHALNAILYGAKKVTTFDINRLSYYMANLKLAAVKTLSYDEFVEFFFGNNAFNYLAYQKICECLHKNIIHYFDQIYKHFEYNGLAIKESYLFHHGHKNHIEDNTYLLDDHYAQLKEKVKDVQVEFINTSVIHLPKHVQTKYDLILLSNISDYAKLFFGDHYLKKFFDFVQNDITPLLNQNGVIQVAYIYDYGEDTDVRSDINIESKRKEVLTEEFEIKTFKSTIKNLKNDAIIIRKGGSSYGK